MQYVEKWPNILWKFWSGHIAKILIYDLPFSTFYMKGLNETMVIEILQNQEISH